MVSRSSLYLSFQMKRRATGTTIVSSMVAAKKKASSKGTHAKAPTACARYTEPKASRSCVISVGVMGVATWKHSARAAQVEMSVAMTAGLRKPSQSTRRFISRWPSQQHANVTACTAVRCIG